MSPVLLFSRVSNAPSRRPARRWSGQDSEPRSTAGGTGLVEMTVLLAVMLALFVTGCSQGDGVERVRVFRVHGKVSHDGKAPENALVLFHPVTRANSQTPNPTGKVKADGTFELTTYESGDGAPAGDYVVTVVWQRLDDAPDGSGDKVVSPNLIPIQFSDPTQSPLRATVAPNPENSVPEIQLTGWASAPARAAPTNPTFSE